MFSNAKKNGLFGLNVFCLKFGWCKLISVYTLITDYTLITGSTLITVDWL